MLSMDIIYKIKIDYTIYYNDAADRTVVMSKLEKKIFLKFVLYILRRVHIKKNNNIDA